MDAFVREKLESQTHLRFHKNDLYLYDTIYLKNVGWFSNDNKRRSTA